MNNGAFDMYVLFYFFDQMCKLFVIIYYMFFFLRNYLLYVIFEDCIFNLNGFDKTYIYYDIYMRFVFLI
jgi:hypothetical protein